MVPCRNNPAPSIETESIAEACEVFERIEITQPKAVATEISAMMIWMRAR